MKAENENVRLIVEQDESPMDPREWDNLGVIVCWHRRYTLGDEQPRVDPKRWLHEWKRGRKEKDYVMLPVYMYDHSGIWLSTSRGYPFNCRWDAGQVGFIYATRERAVELGCEWNLEAIEQQLISEVEVYSQYVSGDVYGFMVERKQPCGHWEHEDSCWGYFGSNWKENGLADSLPEDARPLLEELA